MDDRMCKVLVVDDNRDSSDTTVELLRLWGHDAQAAYSPEEAISKAQTFEPDVVLTDIGLPRMNGFDLAVEMRRYCPNAQFVALTGFTQSDIYRRSRDYGFKDVILKPASADVLKEVVETECAAASEE